MVIKRKDGSTYTPGIQKIPQAEPAITSSVELFNFENIEEKTEVVEPPIAIPEEIAPIVEELIKIEESEVLIEQIPSDDLAEGTVQIEMEFIHKGKNKHKKQHQPRIEKLHGDCKNLNIILIHCMALENGNFSPNYYSFEAVEVEDQDLTYEFWTTCSIPSGSIVFPKGGGRWWRIRDIRELQNGSLFNCLPSKLCPRFGDV